MICDVLQPIRDCICMRKSTAASCSLGFCKYDPPVRTKIESVKLTVDLRVAVEGQGLLTGRQDMGSSVLNRSNRSNQIKYGNSEICQIKLIARI
jgi:hypothetical protein